jgi:hypothetical protein
VNGTYAPGHPLLNVQTRRFRDALSAAGSGTGLSLQRRREYRAPHQGCDAAGADGGRLDVEPSTLAIGRRSHTRYLHGRHETEGMPQCHD